MMLRKEALAMTRNKARPSQKLGEKTEDSRTGCEQSSTKLDSIRGKISLSEIDMEENGYFDGSSIFDASIYTGSMKGSDLTQSVASTQYGVETTVVEQGKDLLNERQTTPRNSGMFYSPRNGTRTNNNSILSTDSLTNSPVGKSNDMLSVTNSFCSDDSLEGELPNEHVRLTTVLDNIDPKRLHNYLKRRLKQHDITAILALSSLLPKKKFKAETLHCVRCHSEFDPKHGDRTCKLFHRETDVMKISLDETGTDFGCESCGTVFRVEGKWKYKQSLNRKHNCGPCFLGKHTVSIDDVIYEPPGIAKSCEDHGCMVFYV